MKKKKTLYYDNLTMVRSENNLGQWIKFFLTGIIQTAEAAVATLKQIIKLKTTIETERIFTMGKRTNQGLAFFHLLFKKPVVTVKDVQAMTDLSPKAANSLAQAFVDMEILVETTGYQRNRIFIFEEYVRMF